MEQPLPPQFDFVFGKWAQEIKADPALAKEQPYKGMGARGGHGSSARRAERQKRQHHDPGEVGRPPGPTHRHPPEALSDRLRAGYTTAPG